MTESHLLGRGFRSQETLNISLCHSPLARSRSREALGMRSPWRALAVPAGHDAGIGRERLWEIGRPRRRSVMRLEGDAQPQAHPGSTYGSCKLSCPEHGTVTGSGICSPLAPSSTTAIKRPADKILYNLNHGPEQSKGKRWTNLSFKTKNLYQVKNKPSISLALSCPYPFSEDTSIEHPMLE